MTWRTSSATPPKPEESSEQGLTLHPLAGHLTLSRNHTYDSCGFVFHVPNYLIRGG